MGKVYKSGIIYDVINALQKPHQKQMKNKSFVLIYMDTPCLASLENFFLL